MSVYFSLITFIINIDSFILSFVILEAKKSTKMFGFLIKKVI